MLFSEQWECTRCNWQNGFVRCRCRNCGESRYHPDRDINRAIAADIRDAQEWDAKHGIAPETRTDTL